MRVIHGADAPWLDSCDEHRNEGGEVGTVTIGALENAVLGRWRMPGFWFRP
jgi:hypothetical protein